MARFIGKRSMSLYINLLELVCIHTNNNTMHSTHIMYYYSRVVVLSTTNTTNTTNTNTTTRVATRSKCITTTS